MSESISQFKSPNLATSFKYAWNGLMVTFLKEKNLRWQAVAFVIVLVLGWAAGLSAVEFCLIVLVSSAVFAMEFMNSAIEYLCDVVHPEFHQSIGFAKDIAAAGVLVMSICALLIGGLLLVPKLIGL